MREEGKCDLSMFGSIAIKLLKKFNMGQVYEIIIILYQKEKLMNEIFDNEKEKKWSYLRKTKT